MPFGPTTYKFTPPTYDEGPMSWGHRLFQFYRVTRGWTVVKTSTGDYVQTRYFSNIDPLILNAEMVYVGGHTYPVSSDEASALEAAGYTVDQILG